jgi:hypothetical protein
VHLKIIPPATFQVQGQFVKDSYSHLSQGATVRLEG